MHENRETSGMCRPSEGRDRSEKALSRTADMYVADESDCTGVPVNRPNKEGRPLAEAGEERAWRKENVVRPSLHFSPRGEAKCVRGPSVRGARRLTTPT